MTDIAVKMICTHWVKPMDRAGVCTASLCNWHDGKTGCKINGELSQRKTSPKDYTTKHDPNRRPL